MKGNRLRMSNFKYIDLFAGIGGFHIAMDAIGGECVFASEIDPFARKTYEHNFKTSNPSLFSNKMFNDDIRKINPIELPDFDVLCAGFPCQPFSQAGQKRGFDDTHKSERGNLFFNIVEILEAKNPPAFFLENVRGIVNHDNGNTFKVIRDIIENELGYSFHYKVVKASDYGLPQLRPRTFMIGFKNENGSSNFSFPPKKPLKFNMSDVWNGKCSREIGFTLRVGGRGSNINDRRNWDSYLVDDEVKKIMPEQARKMQGFPDWFEFPVPNTQAMKQLGNSVAIDAIKACGEAMITHLNTLTKHKVNMTQTKNKDEWSVLYSFLKIINDDKLHCSDKKLHINNNIDNFNVTKVTALNSSESYYLQENDSVLVEDEDTGSTKKIKVSDFINDDILKMLTESIRNGERTFITPEYSLIQNKLGISIVNGEDGNQKDDIVLDTHNDEISKKDEGFGIKSYLSSNQTLLNTSGNTNFIFEILNLNTDAIDVVNSINTRTKLKDRIEKIHHLGGSFKFCKMETESMRYNLSMVDSLIPEIMSKMLLEFYLNRTDSMQSNLENIFNEGNTFSTDLLSLQVKVKRLLVSVLLGGFVGEKWDSNYVSDGTIVFKETGEQVGFHIIDKKSLEEYLFANTKFDIPSTTRHRFGSLILENDGKIYFKLNMQLRF
jgi:DNA (cytosine-5)-methyltransferase 1